MPFYSYRQNECYSSPDWRVAQPVTVNTQSVTFAGRTMPSTYVNGINDAVLWCEENCTMQWRWMTHDWIIEFESADDAAHFVLVFG